MLISFKTDTLYVNMPQYSKQLISNIKALFKYWLERALWHRPTVLVMDNMEKLVGAEVEVTISFFFLLGIDVDCGM